MTDLFITNTTTTPDNFASSRQVSINYENITLYDDKIVVKDLNLNTQIVKMGLLTGKGNISAFRSFIQRVSFKESYMYGQISSSSRFETEDGSLIVEPIKKGLLNTEIEIPRPSNDVYLLVFEESPASVLVYGIELLRGDVAVNNRVVDLRSDPFEAASEPSMYSPNGSKAHVNSYICSNKEAEIEGILIVNMLDLVKESVRYPSLVTVQNVGDFITDVRVGRSIVLDDLTHPFEYDSISVPLEKIEMSYDEKMHIYSFKDESTKKGQGYQYRATIGVEDLTQHLLSNSVDKVQKFNHMMKNITSSSMLASLLGDYIDSLARVIIVSVERMGYIKDLELFYRMVNQETGITNELVSRIFQLIQGLCNFLKQGMDARIDLTGSNSESYNASRNIEHEVVLTNIYKNSMLEKNNGGFVETANVSVLDPTLVLDIQEENRIELIKRLNKVPRAISTSPSLLTTSRQISTVVEKLAERINIGLCEAEVASRQEGPSDDLFITLEKKSVRTYGISYMKGFYDSATTSYWERLNEDSLEEIIRNGLVYLFRIDGSDKIENKYFLLS